MKKGVLENFAKFTGKHLWFAKFSKTPFYRTPLDDCFWLFRATLLKWGTANNVWKTSDEYSLPRDSNLRSTVQVYPESVVRRCSVKKVFLQISLNSQENTCNKVSFLIKLQA